MEYNDIYRIATLIVKSIKKDLSEEEYRELDNWRNGSERNRQLYQKYQQSFLESVLCWTKVIARKEFGKVSGWRLLKRKDVRYGLKLFLMLLA